MAVDVRTGTFSMEYRQKLSAVDISHHGVAKGQIGPLIQRLDNLGELQGLALGRFANSYMACFRSQLRPMPSRNSKPMESPLCGSDIDTAEAHY